jgi:hypothetical protein
MHLAAEEFRIQRLRKFHQSSRTRAAAEEDQCEEQAKELRILMLASQSGFSWSSLEPQLALALARAARDTLMAEEETAKSRVNECENLLATLKDNLDDAHARVKDAHQQIASIMTFIDEQGIQINLRPLEFNSLQIKNSLQDLPDHTSHSHSDSDSDSYRSGHSPNEDEVEDF